MRKFISIFSIMAICMMFSVGIASAECYGGDDYADASNSGTFENNIVFPESKDITTTFNNGKGYRGFAEGGPVPIPGMPSYFGPATPGPQYQPARIVVLYQNRFTKDNVANMLKKAGKTKVITTSLYGEPDFVYDYVDVYVMDKVLESKVDGKLLGYITVQAKNDGTVSAHDMAAAMEEVMKMGGNAMQVTGEGVARTLKAFGWGIGVSYTRASLSANETVGGVSAGGMGISGGEAGYKDKPWVQVTVLQK